MTPEEIEILKKEYEKSFPRMYEGWKKLCEALSILGWKDFYFMVLHMNRLAHKSKSYNLSGNHTKH